jgi:hypothetical protein
MLFENWTNFVDFFFLAMIDLSGGKKQQQKNNIWENEMVNLGQDRY